MRSLKLSAQVSGAAAAHWLVYILAVLCIARFIYLA